MHSMMKHLKEPRDRILTIKFVDGKNLKILVESSYTIYYLNLNIECAYRRNIYPLELQKMSHVKVLLEDDVMLTKKIIQDGYLFLDTKTEEFNTIKLHKEKEETTDSIEETQNMVESDDLGSIKLKEEKEGVMEVEKSKGKNNVWNLSNENNHDVEWDNDICKGSEVPMLPNFSGWNKVFKRILQKKNCKLISKVMEPEVDEIKGKGHKFDLGGENFKYLCMA